MSLTRPIRVRFAPSPTGKLHIGSARTALLNWLFARHYGGAFVLRIEDTDIARSTQESLESILEDLTWLGLDWDEGPDKGGPYAPYFQRERASLYTQFANQLLENGYAYWCYCSQEELAKIKEEALAVKLPPSYNGRCRNISQKQLSLFEEEGRTKVLRFKVPLGETVVNDLIRGEVRFDNKQIEDFVIVRADGQALYNFACVVDDLLMEITHVLRGEEHLPNTPKQILMYKGLDLPIPSFGHLSIILDEQRKKLSKREGATFLSEFRERGFLPESLVNFLALLGWAPKGNKEIFTSLELISEFSVEGVSKSPAIFNWKKLEWMNSQYIKQLPCEELLKYLIPYLKKKGLVNEEILNSKKEWLLGIVKLCQDRIRTLSEFVDMASPLFGSPVIVEDPAARLLLNTDFVPEVFTNLLRELEKPDIVISSLEELVRHEAAQLNLKAVEIIQPLRVAFTGKRVSPGLFEMANLMGKELVIRRIEDAISLIGQFTAML